MASSSSFSSGTSSPDVRLTVFNSTLYIFLCLTAILFALRSWVRLRIQHAFRMDDWFALASFIFFWTLGISQIVSISKGYGNHTWEIPPTTLVWIMKLCFYQQFIYISGLTALRLSSGMLIVRVIPAHSVRYARSIRKINYGAMVFTALLATGFCIVILWSCGDTHGVFMASFRAISILGGLNDLMMALIPGIVVWQLNMRKRDRALAHCLMTIGCVASIGNWIRFAYLEFAFKSSDFLYDALSIDIWTVVEIGLGLVAACAATLLPLLRELQIPAFMRLRSRREERDPPTFDTKLQNRAPHHMELLTFRDEDITFQNAEQSINKTDFQEIISNKRNPMLQ